MSTNEGNEPSAVSATALVDESFLLRVLRDIVESRILAPHSGGERPTTLPEGGPNGQQDSEQERNGIQLDEHLERRMEALWDLCVDTNTADFVATHRGITVLAGAAERAHGEGRIAEVCFGTLANICAHRAVVMSAFAEGSELNDVLRATLRGLRSHDGLSLLQALRVACALLCGPLAAKCGELWSEALRVTCALLCGPLAAKCGELWSEVAIACYVFALEHSLRWEVVQHACDALCQILVLESSATASTESQIDETTAGHCLQPPRIPEKTRAGLLTMLAARCMELTCALAGEVSEAEGDPEVALLSALRLTESFLTVATCPSADVLPLGRAVLRTVACANQPDILIAALEVLAAVFENEIEPNISQSKVAALRGSTEELADEHCDVLAKLSLQVQSFSRCTPGLAEKFALLLEDNDEALEVGHIALVLLQHVPRAEAGEHREVFAQVAEAALLPHPGGQAALAGVSPRFMEFLQENSEEELQ